MVNRLIIIASIVLPLKATSQVLEYSAPEKLPATINTEAEESMPLLSPDGKLLFFTRSLYPGNVGGKYTGHDIWISERSGKDWKKADNKKIDLNSKKSSAVIGIGAAGDVLYLMNASSTKRVNGIYFIRRIGTVWTRPEFIPIPGIESNGFVNFYVSPDFDVVLISMKGLDTRGEEDIYVSTKGSSGEWTLPKNLGTSINTKGFEISPFLSADKKKLYFSSNGYPGLGDADIFVSERLYGSWEVWSVPQNLGKVINSEKFDAYFSLYGDSICFFSSNRSSAYASLYQSKIKIDDGKIQKEKIESIVNETKSLLNEVRNSTQSSIKSDESEILLMYDDSAVTLKAASKEALNSFISHLLDNPERKVKIQYDGRLVDSSKSSQIVNQERIRGLKQTLKSGGVIESRILVLPNLFSSESSKIRLNSITLSME